MVDDEKGIRDLLVYELGASGYDVTAVASGKEALGHLKDNKAHLLISDIKMPKMDGIQVLKAAKEIDPELEVIMATGYGTIEEAVAAMKLGAFDFIQKPFNMDEMHALIERALEKAEMKSLLTLYEASKAVYSHVKMDKLLPVFVDISAKLLKADDVSILLMRDDDHLEMAANTGFGDIEKEKVRIALGQGVAGRVAVSKECVRIDGPLDNDPRFPGIAGHSDIRSSIVCPLLSPKGTLGVLCVARTENKIHFDSTDERYANILAAQVSQAIENANLYNELEGKIESLDQAYRDLSEMQDKMLQTGKLAAIGELASGVAHELNNPLTAVVGLTDLLLSDEPENTEKWEDLKTIKEQTVRCSKIIMNLLQFARQTKSEKKTADINDVLEMAVKLTEYDAKSSSVKVIKEYAAGMPRVTVDINHIQQVFLNILNNARHAMKGTAHPKLVIRTEASDGLVRVSFTDNGCGMTEEVRQKIFNPFFTTKEVGKGTGLGLSISYGIVKDHGGEIHVTSEPDEGTCFTVELPIQKNK